MRETLLSIVVVSCTVAIVAIVWSSRFPLRFSLRATVPWREHLSAENRARNLMREVLTPAEYQQIARFGYVEIPSPSNPQRTYRIPGAGGLVKVFDRGCIVMELCLQPVDPLPDGDVVAMHKLFIQSSEDEYLQRANRFAPGILSLRYHY
jgi:hypothetical protein